MHVAHEREAKATAAKLAAKLAATLVINGRDSESLDL